MIQITKLHSCHLDEGYLGDTLPELYLDEDLVEITPINSESYINQKAFEYIYSDSSILGTMNKFINSIAYIKKLGVTKQIDSLSNIKWTVSKNILTHSFINLSYSKTIDSDSVVSSIHHLVTAINSNSYVKKTFDNEIDSFSAILDTYSKYINSNSVVRQPPTFYIYSDSKIRDPRLTGNNYDKLVYNIKIARLRYNDEPVTLKLDNKTLRLRLKVVT